MQFFVEPYCPTGERMKLLDIYAKMKSDLMQIEGSWSEA